MENKYEISYVKNNVPQANIYIAESEKLAEKFFKSTRPDCLYAEMTVRLVFPLIKMKQNRKVKSYCTIHMMEHTVATKS